MKLPTVLLFLLCAANAAAYSIAGAYERVMYWHAYQLDQQGDGPKLIAKNCAKEEGKGKPCNFKQFLTYIAVEREKPNARALPETLNAHRINADTAAEIIYNGHVTGQYTIPHVYQNIYHPPALFGKVTELIGEKTAGQNVRDYPLNEIMTARKRIETMRVANAIRQAGDHLRRTFDPDNVPHEESDDRRPLVTQGLVTETREQVSQGNNLQYNAVDLQAAGQRIHATTPSFNLKYELRKYNAIPESNNHRANIEAIKQAKQIIMRKCVK